MRRSQAADIDRVRVLREEIFMGKLIGGIDEIFISLGKLSKRKSFSPHLLNGILQAAFTRYVQACRWE